MVDVLSSYFFHVVIVLVVQKADILVTHRNLNRKRQRTGLLYWNWGYLGYTGCTYSTGCSGCKYVSCQCHVPFFFVLKKDYQSYFMALYRNCSYGLYTYQDFLLVLIFANLSDMTNQLTIGLKIVRNEILIYLSNWTLVYSFLKYNQKTHVWNVN